VHRVEGVELPAEGDLVAVQVDGTSVAVTVVDGQVHAVDDECTHMQCSLAGGEVEDGVVVCPCHFGRFDLTTGKVLGGPPEQPLHVWKAAVRDGVLELER
jgi:nitrite reductase/ring-hydroxylating ferredoxin subunit